MQKNKFVVCCVFYNDLQGIKRLYESAPHLDYIFVDGQWFGKNCRLSTDGSREYIESLNFPIIDTYNLIEYECRNTYIKKAESLGYDYCLVIDTDEFIEFLDTDMLNKELEKNLDSYSITCNQDKSSHFPYYRLHKSNARHIEKHQECFIDNKQIFTPSRIIHGIVINHDKSLRDPEQEQERIQYYNKFPIR